MAHCQQDSCAAKLRVRAEASKARANRGLKAKNRFFIAIDVPALLEALKAAFLVPVTVA
jgi:hypothetical protein